MSWSIPIFRVAGILVRIHVTFLLLLAWLAWSYYSQGGSAAAAERVFFILLLFGCVLLHEFGHAIAAKGFGINTPDITLLPIGGVARLERMPEKPSQELIVALAGPAVNVAIALGLFVIVGTSGITDTRSVEDPNLLTKLMVINVWLVLFNLLPAFPMDGGRVVRALLATRLNYARATQIAATVGQAARSSSASSACSETDADLHRALHLHRRVAGGGGGANARRLARDAGLERDGARVPHAHDDSDAVRAVDALLATSQHDFPVVDASGGIAGVLLRMT
jgi:stage IV sporulation protein FB